MIGSSDMELIVRRPANHARKISTERSMYPTGTNMILFVSATQSDAVYITAILTRSDLKAHAKKI